MLEFRNMLINEEFREISQNFSLFGQLLFPIEKYCLNVFLNELKFCKVSQNSKSADSKNVCFLS